MHDKLGKFKISKIHENNVKITNDPDVIYKEYQKVKFLTLDSTYSGQCKMTGGIFGMLQDTVPHGIGRCITNDGTSLYEGQFIDGKMNGYGRYIYDWGGYFEGVWQNDRWNGQGKYLNDEGIVYEGEWLNGTPHGNLTITKPNG